MTFYCFIGIYLILLALSFFYINAKWKYYVADDVFPEINMLISSNRLYRVWPTDYRFFSLKFSVLRHTAASLLSAIAIWFVDLNLLNTALLTLNALYACTALLRYIPRRQTYNSCKEAAGAGDISDISVAIFTPVKNACLVSCIASIANYVLLLAVYAARP